MICRLIRHLRGSTKRDAETDRIVQDGHEQHMIVLAKIRGDVSAAERLVKELEQDIRAW